MQRLSEKEILRRIRRQEPFSAVAASGAYSIRIDRYVPAVGTAIHAGHSVDHHMSARLLLSVAEKRRMEEPYTDAMLASFPVILAGCNSPILYDLDHAVAAGPLAGNGSKEIWHGPFSARERESIQSRHDGYYRVLDALLTALEKKFGCCIVYDLQSYNRKDRAQDSPSFNIGTRYIDRQRYQPILKHLEQRLLVAELPNSTTRVAYDEISRGEGYQAAYMHTHHQQSLCIPLAIKKVFMDELTGEPYPLILETVKETLKQALSYNAAYFARKFVGRRIQRARYFAEESDQVIRRVDAALYRVAKGIDTLRYINPINLARERKRFVARPFDFSPDFHYRQLKIDPFEFRRKLYAIPVDSIQDVSIRQLYRNTIDMFARKIDLLTTIGADHFLYNSLRFHGQPAEEDIRLAHFFITAPSDMEENGRKGLGAEQCAREFCRAGERYDFDISVELSSRIVARAMVSTGRRKVLINRNAEFSETEIQALIHHELGIHMVTTLNADKQALKIFKLGLPGSTETQEGLAILSEFLSGNLTLARIKDLALRVMAVHMLVRNYEFGRTCRALIDDYGMSRKAAFGLTVRVYRGGGFTKDFLYLTGLRKVLRLYQAGVDLQPLFIGKTSIAYIDTLQEMLEREVVSRPVHLPMAWNMAVENNPILNYLLKAFTS